MDVLDNLVKINKLHKEPFDQTEFDGMLMAAKVKLQDTRLKGLSKDSQFMLSYSAAHALSLAALRWHGYRSDNRYLVFQCLQHTVGFSSTQWRILDQCHQKRNIAEYEGHLDINNALLKESLNLTRLLYGKVHSLSEGK
jgi:hypothetical protein